MLKLLPFVLCALTLRTCAQTFLCNESPFTECFRLDSNGTFKYDRSNCTGNETGAGRYEMTKKSITFLFDSLCNPAEVHGRHIGSADGMLYISCYYFMYDTPYEDARIVYDQQSYKTSGGSARLKYTGGPVVIYRYEGGDSLIIYPDKENFNAYGIGWPFLKYTVVKAGTVVKMEKKGKRYEFKEEAMVYDIQKDTTYPGSYTVYYKIKKNKR